MSSNRMSDFLFISVQSSLSQRAIQMMANPILPMSRHKQKYLDALLSLQPTQEYKLWLQSRS